MKKTITGLIILGLGIGFPSCIGIYLIETKNTEDNIIDENKTDDFPQKETVELPKKEKPKDPIVAYINVDPDSLNVKSKGNWITVYIALAAGYDVNHILLDSVFLNEVVPTAPISEILDFNDDNCPDLMVKFNRTLVKNVVEFQEFVTIIITGKLIDGREFEGTDIIELIHFLEV
jgi:hypothetical protein